MKKWRINWLESERGWGTEVWFNDYDTKELADAAYQKAYDEAASQTHTPDYYIIPLDWKKPYEVEVETNEG